MIAAAAKKPQRPVATLEELLGKRVILEIFDVLIEPTPTGGPYVTPLDPSPSDLRVVHSRRPPVPEDGR